MDVYLSIIVSIRKLDLYKIHVNVNIIDVYFSLFIMQHKRIDMAIITSVFKTN